MENGCKVKDTVEEHLPRKAEVVMKDNGAIIIHRVKENLSIIKMSIIRALLFVIADKVMENTSISM